MTGLASRFEGQRAVVTGGASGIGLAIARRLASEGAVVALWDRDAAQLDEAAASMPEGKLVGIQVDVCRPEAVKTAIFAQMTQAHIDFALSKIPLGRFGTVDEITALICGIASEECSFTTDAVFDASRGRATY